MLKSLSGLQWLVKVISDPEIAKDRDAHLELKNSFWLLIQQLIPQLELLKAAADYLEGDQYITVAAIVPTIKGLVVQLLKQVTINCRFKSHTS